MDDTNVLNMYVETMVPVIKSTKTYVPYTLEEREAFHLWRRVSYIWKDAIQSSKYNHKKYPKLLTLHKQLEEKSSQMYFSILHETHSLAEFMYALYKLCSSYVVSRDSKSFDNVNEWKVFICFMYDILNASPIEECVDKHLIKTFIDQLDIHNYKYKDIVTVLIRMIRIRGIPTRIYKNISVTKNYMRETMIVESHDTIERMSSLVEDYKNDYCRIQKNIDENRKALKQYCINILNTTTELSEYILILDECNDDSVYRYTDFGYKYEYSDNFRYIRVDIQNTIFVPLARELLKQHKNEEYVSEHILKTYLKSLTTYSNTTFVCHLIKQRGLSVRVYNLFPIQEQTIDDKCKNIIVKILNQKTQLQLSNLPINRKNIGRDGYTKSAHMVKKAMENHERYIRDLSKQINDNIPHYTDTEDVLEHDRIVAEKTYKCIEAIYLDKIQKIHGDIGDLSKCMLRLWTQMKNSYNYSWCI